MPTTEIWVLRISDYAGEATIDFTIERNELTQINLVSKSLSAEFLWSSDLEPAVGFDYELFYYDGVDFVSIGIFTTNASGIITISELLPCGTYKFDDLIEFSITANDLIKTLTYSVESILGGKSFSLGFCRDTKSKHFFFFVFKLMLIGISRLPLNRQSRWQPIKFLSFGLHPSSPMHQPTAQFNIGGN